MDHEQLRQSLLQMLKKNPDKCWDMRSVCQMLELELVRAGHLQPDTSNRYAIPGPFLEAAREVVWGLLSHGILYLSRDPSYADQQLRVDEFRLSAKGRRYLDDEVYDLNDTTGYIAKLKIALSFSPVANETILAYAAEGIRAYDSSMPLASVVMTGCAAEAAILEVITAFSRSPLVTSKDAQDFAKKATSSIKAKFDWFRTVFSAKHVEDRDVADWIEHIVSGAGILMSTRNAGGHPERANPTLDDARANLVLFQSVLPRLGQLYRYLCDQSASVLT